MPYTADQGPEGGGRLAADISNAVGHLMHEYTGRGPTQSRAVVDEDLICVVLRGGLTKAERRLTADGEADAVLAVRQRFQVAMSKDLVGAVERLADRKVIAFMSANHLEPDVACEVFVLDRPV
jgi:uncharacterized protein YbcI